ncbi:retinal Mueller cells isomerohydrolase-like [Babylonia areolata]|uniref:retinal Mueller cells isomerohydrolase-like n=1 Tax=Babylonia areolata TaxID=304850 RepID=UPI003FD4E880
MSGTEMSDTPGNTAHPEPSTWLMFQSEMETLTPVDTQVTGQIPQWLSGTLYRNGCGLFDEGTAATTHLFEGYSVLHRYDIGQGGVKYTSRVLHREAWLRAVKAHRLAVAPDGSTKEYVDPCMATFSGDKLFALTESPVLQEIDPVSLTSQGKLDLQKVLSVHMATAHPHFGPDGAMYNIGTAFAPPNNYNIIKIPPRALATEDEVTRRVKLVASLQSRWNFGISYSHSFGMTERHFILLEQPATLNAMKIMQEGTGKFKPASVFKNFDLHPKEKIRFHLVSRRHGNKVVSTQYYANPCFTFHFVNCYDDGDYVVVDLAGYDNLNIINDLMLSHIADSREDIVTATIRRYVLPLNIEKAPLCHNLRTLPYTTARAKVTAPGVVHLTPDYICKPQDKVYVELPRINYELYNGKKYRYIYGTSMLTKFHRLIKLDVDTRTPTYWEEEDCDPGEPVFVPRPGAASEDDGVVLSPVVRLGHTNDTSCFLLILDARSFTEVARATTPRGVRIAPSFHGNFYLQAE